MADKKEFPNLELVFDFDSPKRFLIEAAWRVDTTHRASDKLITEPPGGKYFRAICIFMALAKFHGPHGENPDDAIVFRETKARDSWLNFLGNSMGPDRQKDFFWRYFDEVKFLNFERGSAHLKSMRQTGGGTLPVAAYYPAKLRFGNLLLYRFQSPENVLLERDDLASLAELLEKHGGWEPIVPEIVARIQRNRPSEPATGELEKASESHDATASPLATPNSDALPKDSSKPSNSPQQAGIQSSPYVLSGRWRDLFRNVAREKVGQLKGFDWFVICENPPWLDEWMEIFRKAVISDGAKVKVLLPAVSRSCLSVVAQWRAICSHLALNDPIDYGIDQTLEAMTQMDDWNKEAARGTLGESRGFFEVYTSKIAHPYSAILALPANAGKSPQFTQRAPDAAWCLLNLDAFCTSINDRCGIYLSQPSEMLDLYYNSITRLFASAEHSEYIKRVFSGRA